MNIEHLPSRFELATAEFCRQPVRQASCELVDFVIPVTSSKKRWAPGARCPPHDSSLLLKHR